MRQVVFNALQTSLSGGIGRYSYELSKEIYNVHKIDFKIVVRKEDLNLFSFADVKDLIIAKGIKNSKDRNYYEQFVLPKLISKKYPRAIIHYPDSMAPLLAKNKVIITVHDLAFKAIKGAFTWKTTVWKNLITYFSMKKADKVIAITNFTKNEILKYYKVKPFKVNVIYNGFNDFSKEQINYNRVSKKILDLKEKTYILTVSTISPRKNIDGLIKAYALIKDKIKNTLVVAGKDGWLYQDVYKLVEALNLKDKIIFTGEINDDELKFLYKNSKLFVYPSLYEGFGLPPLEAMSFGIPVVVSNVTSMPEILGDSVIYFNPANISEISDAIEDGIKLKSIIFSKTKYSWSKCCNNTMLVYINR